MTKSFRELSDHDFRINLKEQIQLFQLKMKNSYRTKKTLFANTFNNYFTDVTHSLGLKKKNIGLQNSLSKIVKTFRKFEGIKTIKQSQQEAENYAFSFKVISEQEVKNAIKDLTISKSTISGDIPTKIYKYTTLRFWLEYHQKQYICSDLL